MLILYIIANELLFDPESVETFLSFIDVYYSFSQ